MGPEDNKNKIDAETFGKSSEQKKEAIVDATKSAQAESERIKSDPQVQANRKVGIRTYRDYAAAELKKGGGTLTKMIIQERDRDREEKRHSVKNKKNVLISFLSFFFVLAGFGVVALSFVLVTQRQEEAQERNSFIVAPNPLVISDFRKEIYLGDPTASKISRAVKQEIEETTIPVGSIKHVYFSQDGIDNPKELVNANAFLSFMESQAPASLFRTFESDFMYGLYSSTEVSPFLMFKISSYNTAFSGMLEWEQNMIKNLEDLFTRDLSDTDRRVFQDIVLYNTDVRVILDDKGEVMFGYGFLQDKTTLIIFDNRLTLRELITRSQNNTIRQ